MGNYVGLASLSDHSTKLTRLSVRNMLLDGHIFVVVVFKGENSNTTGSCLLIWKKRKHKRCAS